MKRRDVVRALLTPEPADAATHPAHEPVQRVPSQAVRAMGLEINRLTEEAQAAAALREQLAQGGAVAELDPATVDSSFISDRLAPTEDADYRHLVESMRDAGQLVPILVRPHPAIAGHYQIAYGHRRRHAAAELGRAVRAIVRTMTDTELVVAQGKENAERRNLSFIERAMFAARLDARGFDRRTLNAALGVHSAETTRFLAVAAAVPAELIHAIGPAPKAGRPRWMELAALLERNGADTALEPLLQRPSFATLGSDARFEAVLRALRGETDRPAQEVIRDAEGQPVIRVEPTARGLRFAVEERLAPGLGIWLLEALPDLVRSYEATQATHEAS